MHVTTPPDTHIHRLSPKGDSLNSVYSFYIVWYLLLKLFVTHELFLRSPHGLRPAVYRNDGVDKILTFCKKHFAREDGCWNARVFSFPTEHRTRKGVSLLVHSKCSKFCFKNIVYQIFFFLSGVSFYSGWVPAFYGTWVRILFSKLLGAWKVNFLRLYGQFCFSWMKALLDSSVSPINKSFCQSQLLWATEDMTLDFKISQAPYVCI